MFSRFSHLLLGLIFFPLMACAAGQDQYQDGVHYITLPEPVATQTGDNVEVAEIFWYGCGHCYTFEPLVNQWEKSLPEGVELVKSPAMWNAPMKIHRKCFTQLRHWAYLRRFTKIYSTRCMSSVSV